MLARFRPGRYALHPLVWLAATWLVARGETTRGEGEVRVGDGDLRGAQLPLNLAAAAKVGGGAEQHGIPVFTELTGWSCFVTRISAIPALLIGAPVEALCAGRGRCRVE